MRNLKSLIAVAVAAAFAMPFAATAASHKAPGSPAATSPSSPGGAAGNGGSVSSMKQLDTNNDGSVSREEAKKDANISRRFKELDKDNDGKLSATELSAAQATGAGGSAKDKSGSK